MLLTITIFSICCFSNFVTVCSIDDEKIVELENFVRDELLDLLRDECTERNSVLNDVDRKIFFGLYHAKPEKFRFLPGEKVMLKKIADHMNLVNSDEEKTNQSFQLKAPAKYKISRKDTCKVFGALFFGKKNYNPKQRVQQMNTEAKQKLANHEPVGKSSLSSMVPEVITKARIKFEKKDPSLVGQNYLTEDMVRIVDELGRITARLQCVFCLKNNPTKPPITIQYDSSSNTPDSFYWNFSNLVKHFKRIHSDIDSSKVNIAETSSKKTESDETLHDDLEVLDEVVETVETKAQTSYEVIDVIVLDESELNSSSELIDEYELPSKGHGDAAQNSSSSDNGIQGDGNSLDVNSIEFAIYNQIGQQNLVMTAAVYSNSENKQTMMFKLNGPPKALSIIKIKGDGSCFYGSVVHQLFQHKVNSKDHKNATIDLRASVVKFINENIPDYLFVIKDRIMEEIEARGGVVSKSAEISEADCIEFVNSNLARVHTFAGMESFIAISSIHSVNIMVFTESGPPYFPLGFNANLHRLIFIAYRRAPRNPNILNHYDSVVEVSVDVLFECVRAVANQTRKKQNEHSEPLVI